MLGDKYITLTEQPLTGYNVVTAVSQPQPAPAVVIAAQEWSQLYQPQVIHLQPIAHYLAVVWSLYDVARGKFVERVQHGFYHYERHEEWRICALAAIYIGLTNATPASIASTDFDMIEFGITRLTGRNLRYIYAPAATSDGIVAKGQIVSLFAHLVTLTDNGWHPNEIIGYCRAAEAWHDQQATKENQTWKK